MATTGARRVFIDSNILVYATVTTAPLYHRAYQTLQSFHASQDELWISRQVLREYAMVVTRPQSFMQPVNGPVAAQQLQVFTGQFQIADETASVTLQLIKLLQTLSIGGKQIHDANIVATMMTYHVSHLLTHNVSDFNRYQHLITIISL
jgi:predicted nucleic acid-binding protein